MACDSSAVQLCTENNVVFHCRRHLQVCHPTEAKGEMKCSYSVFQVNLPSLVSCLDHITRITIISCSGLSGVFQHQ